MNMHIKNSRGFMGVIAIIIIGVAALAYFKVDLHAFVSSPVMQKFLSIFRDAWHNYLLPLGVFLKASITGLVK